MERFNYYDPIEDTERRMEADDWRDQTGFNYYDPIEDTERGGLRRYTATIRGFQLLRSDRGY